MGSSILQILPNEAPDEAPVHTFVDLYPWMRISLSSAHKSDLRTLSIACTSYTDKWALSDQIVWNLPESLTNECFCRILVCYFLKDATNNITTQTMGRAFEDPVVELSRNHRSADHGEIIAVDHRLGLPTNASKSRQHPPLKPSIGLPNLQNVSRRSPRLPLPTWRVQPNLLMILLSFPRDLLALLELRFGKFEHPPYHTPSNLIER